jgi:hypothetical protein
MDVLSRVVGSHTMVETLAASFSDVTTSTRDTLHQTLVWWSLSVRYESFLEAYVEQCAWQALRHIPSWILQKNCWWKG